MQLLPENMLIRASSVRLRAVVSAMPVRALTGGYIRILATCVAVLLAVAVEAAPLNVNLILSDSSMPYRQFSDSFSRNLAASMPEVNVEESSVIGGAGADLIIAVGMKAAELASAQFDTPVLAVMIPDSGYRELLTQRPKKQEISAIFLNQPWSRRLDFLRAAIPGRHRVGLLYSSKAQIDTENLRKDIVRRGGLLVERKVDSSDALFPALEEVLTGSDVLMAIPDSMIYTGNNIRNILLTSYRHNIPLIGISKAYVNAGALCAVFSTPEQLAGQAVEIAISYLRSGKLPPPQYPEKFTIEINSPVARSLGIELPSHEAILSRMLNTGEAK